MKITFSYLRLPSRGGLAVAVADKRKPLPTAAKLDRSTGGALTRAMASSRFWKWRRIMRGVLTRYNATSSPAAI